jgi:hypothetical protein
MNNQATLGAGQPFRAELTQSQEVRGDGKTTSIFVKIIFTLVVLGIAIASLPGIFCGLMLLGVMMMDVIETSGSLGLIIFLGVLTIPTIILILRKHYLIASPYLLFIVYLVYIMVSSSYFNLNLFMKYLNLVMLLYGIVAVQIFLLILTIGFKKIFKKK